VTVTDTPRTLKDAVTRLDAIEGALASYFAATEGDATPERAGRQAQAIAILLAAAARAYVQLTGRPLYVGLGSSGGLGDIWRERTHADGVHRRRLGNHA
jgi:hypothetical protein